MKDPALERALEELPDGGGPREGWQETVLARIEVAAAPVRRARWPLVVAGSGVLAAAVVLFVALRSPERSAPPAPQVEESAALERLEREIDQLSDVKEHAAEQIVRATTEAERAQAMDQLLRAKEKVRAVEQALKSLRARTRKSGGSGAIVAKCEPNDPLCGID
ncbi:MAG TPA: hypothetical protein VFU21_06385 [Kofleriaceae bacterium]|nr:hypothetical protein [Kofleriaceae bacterium]